MQQLRNSFILFLFCILPFTVWCAPKKTPINLKNKMISSLDVIHNAYSTKYAPTEWKKNYANWDLDAQIALAKTQVLAANNLTIRDCQCIFKKFFKSTRDYHVDVIFHSTAASLLPFTVQSAGNRYFIIWADKSVCPSEIQVGDEVLSFGGKPIHDAVQEVKLRELGNPESLTDQVFAEMFLTVRIGMLGHEVANGAIPVVITHRNSNKTKTYNFKWVSLPEEISAGPVSMRAMVLPENLKSVVASAQTSSDNNSFLEKDTFYKRMVAGNYDSIKNVINQKSRLLFNQDSLQEDQFRIGSKNGPLPNLGKAYWTSASSAKFRAYMYKLENGKRIGYIRIPEFDGDDEMAKEFSTVINKFQKETDGLVVDQLDNPGGFEFYMYAIASMLSPKELKVPMQRITLTQEDVMEAIGILRLIEEYGVDKILAEFQNNGSSPTILGLPLTREFITGMQDYCQFVIREWNEGRQFTDPVLPKGIKTLKPHPWGCYNKPILVLINEADISCADYFPAILQDNNRAKIFGARTAGAGGYVHFESYPNLLGMAGFSLTGSMGLRADLNPIENLGVNPDVPYSLTADDLQFNYRDYQKAVNETLTNMLQK